MSVPKLPIDPFWVTHTLTPYLLHVFSHILHPSEDITPIISRALEFSQTKPDFHTDGDDLLFERIYLALKHKLKGIPAETNVLTENLEPLARFLIRRAQLKGSYELLARNLEPSSSWKSFEIGRRERLAAETSKGTVVSKRVDAEERAGGGVAKRRASRKVDSASVDTMTDADRWLDPRLVYAQPGQFTDPRLSGVLSVNEDQYYRQHNERIWAEFAMRLANQQYITSSYFGPGVPQYHPYLMSQIQQLHTGNLHQRPPQDPYAYLPSPYQPLLNSTPGVHAHPAPTSISPTPTQPDGISPSFP